MFSPFKKLYEDANSGVILSLLHGQCCETVWVSVLERMIWERQKYSDGDPFSKW